MNDLTIVERQLGRRPRAFRGVAVRCPFGLPAVTEQDPYDDHGAPFPTTYYLTCPQLVSSVSRLEAAGGVERWSEAIAESPTLSADLARATAEQRRIRRSLAGGRAGVDDGASLDWGIGGSRNPAQLKCLHAHVAFALAQPDYAVGAAMMSEIPRALALEMLLLRFEGRVNQDIERFRRDWDDGYRRFELSSQDPARAERLQAHLDIVSAELRRRVGGTFTLATLSAVYEASDGWTRQVIEEQAPTRGWARDVAVVSDAAFHVYARGAVDYAP